MGVITPETDLEGTGIDFFIPQTLQYFGSPAGHVAIDPVPPAVSRKEWAVNVPNYIIEEPSNKFGADNLIYGRDSLFGLYNCKDGLIKDGVKDVFMDIRG